MSNHPVIQAVIAAPTTLRVRGADLRTTEPAAIPDKVEILESHGYTIRLVRNHGGGFAAYYDNKRATGESADAALGALLRVGAFGDFTIHEP